LLQLVIAGKGWVHLRGQREPIPLRGGHLLLHDPNTEGYYVYERQDYVQMFLVRFGGPFANARARELQDSLGRCSAVDPVLYDELSACIDRMGRFDCERHTPRRWGMPETTLSEIFWILDGKPDDRLRSGYQQAINERTINMYLHEYACEPFDLRHMAEHFAVSVSTMTRKVKQLTGQTAVQLVNGWRVTEAQRLLRQPHARVSEVGRQLGWSDRRQFTRVFTAAMGRSPKQFAMDSLEKTSKY
jgi:AraC-like DNA-binding protein